MFHKHIFSNELLIQKFSAYLMDLDFSSRLSGHQKFLIFPKNTNVSRILVLVVQKRIDTFSDKQSRFIKTFENF